MKARAGFTVAELLVAGLILLVLAGGLLALVDPGPSVARARAAAVDIDQRLRAVAEALGANLALAGNGPVNGVSGAPFGASAATVLPYRVGPQGDPDGTVRSDALTLISASGSAAAATLPGGWVPAGGAATIALGPGCPAGDASCGFRAGGAALVLDGRGQADIFRIDAVTGVLLALVPRGATSGRSFPPGSVVVPVTVTTYYLEPGAGPDGSQLMSGDGDQFDMPLADHVTRLAFELFGEPRPPTLGAGPPPLRANYGPSPPPPLEDDPRDSWGAGENCTFADTTAGQASRLPALRPGTSLVPLGAAMLTDGPWCPDASAPGRYDADLFRVRAVRVTVRVEAASAAGRGRDPTLFLRPGTSRDRSSPAADQEVVLDIVPRALQRGR